MFTPGIGKGVGGSSVDGPFVGSGVASGVGFGGGSDDGFGKV